MGTGSEKIYEKFIYRVNTLTTVAYTLGCEGIIPQFVQPQRIWKRYWRRFWLGYFFDQKGKNLITFREGEREKKEQLFFLYNIFSSLEILIIDKLRIEFTAFTSYGRSYFFKHFNDSYSSFNSNSRGKKGRMHSNNIF